MLVDGHSTEGLLEQLQHHRQRYLRGGRRGAGHGSSSGGSSGTVGRVVHGRRGERARLRRYRRRGRAAGERTRTTGGMGCGRRAGTGVQRSPPYPPFPAVAPQPGPNGARADDAGRAAEAAEELAGALRGQLTGLEDAQAALAGERPSRNIGTKSHAYAEFLICQGIMSVRGTLTDSCWAARGVKRTVYMQCVH